MKIWASKIYFRMQIVSPEVYLLKPWKRRKNIYFLIILLFFNIKNYRINNIYQNVEAGELWWVTLRGQIFLLYSNSMKETRSSPAWFDPWPGFNPANNGALLKIKGCNEKSLRITYLHIRLNRKDQHNRTRSILSPA